MQKGWKIAVLILLVVAVAAAFSMKNKKAPEVASVNTTTSDKTPSVIPNVVTPVEPQQEVKEAAVKVVAVKPVIIEKKALAVAKNKTAKPMTQPEKKVKPVTVKPKEPVKLPKLLDLGADKCIPCKMMAPILEELKKEQAGKLEVVFIDVWKNQSEAEKYGIQSIPTQIFYDSEGNELSRHIGFISKEDIIAKFKEHGIELQGSNP